MVKVIVYSHLRRVSLFKYVLCIRMYKNVSVISSTNVQIFNEVACCYKLPKTNGYGARNVTNYPFNIKSVSHRLDNRWHLSKYMCNLLLFQ
jgi:hypothetical protein